LNRIGNGDIIAAFLRLRIFHFLATAQEGCGMNGLSHHAGYKRKNSLMNSSGRYVRRFSCFSLFEAPFMR
jgi:hypothetical protein